MRQWEEVPALSGTALGLLIKYLLNHPNPLAIVSAYLMAIRAEVVHRFKVRPTAQLEEALAKLQQVQVRGVLRPCCPRRGGGDEGRAVEGCADGISFEAMQGEAGGGRPGKGAE